jgi:hypothetical protein
VGALVGNGRPLPFAENARTIRRDVARQASLEMWSVKRRRRVVLTPRGELLSIATAAQVYGIAESTVASRARARRAGWRYLNGA